MTKNKSILAFAIMSFTFLAMGMGTTSPALASIGKAFPDVDFSLILLVATIPALAMIPSSMIGGKLAGGIVRFKTIVLSGIILFIVGGTLPYFMNNFPLILVMRVVLGIGLGLMSPVAPALIMNLFEGKTRENLMGINGVVQNIGGIVFQMLGGILCAIHWRDTFLAHLLAVIPFLIVLFLLVEPPKVEKASSEKIKMPGGVYSWAIIFGVYTLLLYPMLTGMSSLVIDNNLGTAAGAGLALTMFTVGGMISGAVFGQLFRFAGRFTFVAGVLLNAVGYIFMVYGNSLTLLIIGATIVGVGFGIILPAVMMEIGLLVPPQVTPFAISLAIAFMSVGGFLSGFFFALLKGTFGITSMRFPFVFGIACFVLYSVVNILQNINAPKAAKPTVQQ